MISGSPLGSGVVVSWEGEGSPGGGEEWAPYKIVTNYREAKKGSFSQVSGVNTENSWL